MAELIMGPLIGPLVSIVKEKASNYLLEQYKVMEGMEEQHEILMRKLPAILDVITEAEEQAAQREGARAWLQALKKVAYEANDAFDEFKYEALRRKARKDGHYGKLGLVDTLKLFPSHNHIVFRNRMGKKLRKIVQSIEVLVAEMNAFGFTYDPQRQVSKKWRQTDHNIDDPMKIAERSRGKDIEKVVKILLDQASNADLAVVPIVGMGGQGKTTLAQLVYNDPQVQKHFQLPLWVCVSDNFDVDSLAKIIVEAAATNKKDDSKSSQDRLQKEVNQTATNKKDDSKSSQDIEKDGSKSPLDRLQKVLSGQRYLLVLDDVWKSGINFSDKWEKLKVRLLVKKSDELQNDAAELQNGGGGMGNAVLIITRDEGVAQAMGTVEAYNLTALEKIFTKEIIKTTAFGAQKEGKPELLEMVGEIADKCKGSPLAATALGSVLRTKTSEEEWTAVSTKSFISDEETGILPILKLSYNDLPARMKQCFAFCAVFPKDYEIDVGEMIQLWMANGFIPDQKEVRPETIGRQIFNELASRSFFQDVKYVPDDIYDKRMTYFPLRKSTHGYCSRMTCKIHDLMHDVAQSVMQKECVTMAKKPSQTELFPSTARHLLLTCQDQETLLNDDSLKKTSPAIQTLLCHGGRVYGSLQHPSKYSSVRALRLCQNRSTFLLKPKHLHHLRYLDLSYSGIRALPEDISILYNLQTLNLSGCDDLRQLPRQMKYMNALRHLYTDGCDKLKCMPPDLSRLTSLQTLTCFVVGADSDCSNLGELQHLNLCGRLELRQLENVTGEDAKVANLGNKKELRELTLTWSSREEEEQQHNDMVVLEHLELHDGLQALTIRGYQGTTSPDWMVKLRKVVELRFFDCKNLQKLPPLRQPQELQFLSLYGLKKLKFLFSGDTYSTFSKLKEVELENLPDFERWFEIDGWQGELIMFPQLEKLSIHNCEKLTALLEAPQVHVDTSFTFPKLKKLELINLPDFEKWLEIDGRQREQIMFPQLEKLSIENCKKLTALPEAPLLLGDHTSSNSAFPELKAIELVDLDSLKSWGMTEGIDGEHSTFPNLENASIWGCPELTNFPQAPKLTKLSIITCGKLVYDGGEIELPADLAESPQSTMSLYGCNFFHLSAHWSLRCFVQLQDLSINHCDGLVHWPEKEFQSLALLRTLDIRKCSKLTGYAQPPDQSTSERRQLLPCLKSLEIKNCESLVEIFNVAESLKTMYIRDCPKLEFKFRKQTEQQAVIQPGADMMPSSATELFLPCLESLSLDNCDSISELLNLPSTLTHITVGKCHKIETLSLESCSGELPSLKSLKLYSCDCLVAIPNEPQSYMSLQSLTIKHCRGIKSLPTCLQQRLGDLEEKDIDAHIEGPRLSKPKTWKYAISRAC